VECVQAAQIYLLTISYIQGDDQYGQRETKDS
jgi:hypothetical protein